MIPAVMPEIEVELNERTEEPAATVPEKDLVSELFVASVTDIPTPYDVLADTTVTVPEIAPVAVFNVRPAGRDPLVIAKVSGAIPPEVEIIDETGPTAIPGSDVERILTLPAGFAPMVPVNCLD